MVCRPAALFAVRQCATLAGPVSPRLGDTVRPFRPPARKPLPICEAPKPAPIGEAGAAAAWPLPSPRKQPQPNRFGGRPRKITPDWNERFCDGQFFIIEVNVTPEWIRESNGMCNSVGCAIVWAL